MAPDTSKAYLCYLGNRTSPITYLGKQGYPHIYILRPCTSRFAIRVLCTSRRSIVSKIAVSIEKQALVFLQTLELIVYSNHYHYGRGDIERTIEQS